MYLDFFVKVLNHKHTQSQSESSVLKEMACIHSLIFIFTCPRLCLSLVAPMLDNVSVHDRHGMRLSLVTHLASNCPDVLDSVIAEDGVIGITNISKSFTLISSWNSQQGKSSHMISIQCTEICTHQS